MDSNDGKQAELDIQRAQILFRQAGFTFAGVIVGAVLIFLIIFPLLDRAVAASWFLMVLASIPIRFSILRGFKREKKKGPVTAEAARFWERCWAWSSAAPALTVVSSLFLPYPNDHLLIFLFISLVLVSMTAGSIISSITSIKTVMIFMVLTILPLVTKSFMEASGYYLVLGGFFIIFFLVFSSLALRMNKTVLAAIKLQIDNQEMAYKDPLTGLWNRQKLFSVVDNMGEPLYSLLMIDVDHFKQFNDKFGHSRGDEILSEISTCIAHCAHSKDLVVRYGGEEFLILVPEASVSEATELAEEIRQYVFGSCGKTVSIGITDSAEEKDFDALVEQADKAMYQAKKDGRNCVRSFQKHSLDASKTTKQPQTVQA